MVVLIQICPLLTMQHFITSNNYKTQKPRRHFSFPKLLLLKLSLLGAKLGSGCQSGRYVHSRARRKHFAKQVAQSRITKFIPSTANSFTTLKQGIHTIPKTYVQATALFRHHSHFKFSEPLEWLRHTG